MDLLFDTYTDGGGRTCRSGPRQLTDLVRIDGDLHAPPIGRVLMGRVPIPGGRRQDQPTVHNVPAGRNAGPGHALRDVHAVPDDPGTAGTASAQLGRQDQARMFTDRTTPWLLADREYGDVDHWRRIARANRIDEPRRIGARHRPGASATRAREDGGAAWPPRRLTSWRRSIGDFYVPTFTVTRGRRRRACASCS